MDCFEIEFTKQTQVCFYFYIQESPPKTDAKHGSASSEPEPTTTSTMDDAEMAECPKPGCPPTPAEPSPTPAEPSPTPASAEVNPTDALLSMEAGLEQNLFSFLWAILIGCQFKILKFPQPIKISQ